MSATHDPNLGTPFFLAGNTPLTELSKPILLQLACLVGDVAAMGDAKAFDFIIDNTRTILETGFQKLRENYRE